VKEIGWEAQLAISFLYRVQSTQLFLECCCLWKYL